MVRTQRVKTKLTHKTGPAQTNTSAQKSAHITGVLPLRWHFTQRWLCRVRWMPLYATDGGYY